MAIHPLLPDPAGLTLDQLRIQGDVVVFDVHTDAATVACPRCGQAAQRLHSRYHRTLRDLPWQGNAVQFHVTVRKFFCDNRACSQRIFAERLPGLTRCYARKTNRLLDALRELAYLAGGQAAARIARAFGLLVSADTLLDTLRRTSASAAATPRVLGIDDFAFRKGRTYGTILVDLERHCPVDLLADRDAKTVTTWLREHPGVEIISRDRSETYRNASTTGAPGALQVADRFHLVKNMGDTLKHVLERHHRSLRMTAQSLAEQEAAGSSAEASAGPSAETSAKTAWQPGNGQALAWPQSLTPVTVRLTPTEKAGQQAACGRERKQAHYEHVQRLYRQGFNQSAIARQTGLCRTTIRKYLRTDTCPHYPQRAPRPGHLTTYRGYLKQRWDEGCHNAADLLGEIQARGYRGKYSILREMLQPWRACLPEEERGRTTGAKTTRRLRYGVPSAAAVRWWLLGHLSKADPQNQAWQRAFVEKLCTLCPDVAAASTLTSAFVRLVKERRAAELDAWLEEARRGGVSELRRFAEGLLCDKTAVTAALSQEWSNGPVEGQVNRLKTVKRVGYGRAGFALLKARVLPLPATA